MSGQQSKQSGSQAQFGTGTSAYTNTSNFGQNVFNEAALKQLYDKAASLYGAQVQGTNKLQPQAQGYINTVNKNALGDWVHQLQGGAYSGVSGADIYGQLKNSLNTPSNTSQIYAQMMGGKGNNYADAMKAQYIKDANRAEQQMMGNLDARAAASGMSGGSRHGVAEGLGMQGINDSLQKQLATTGYETFDKDLANKLGIAQMADQSTLTRQQMLQDMLAQKQGSATGALSNAGTMQNLGMGSFAPQQINWQNLQQYLAAIGGPTVLNRGTSTGAGSASGSSFGMGSQAGKSGAGGI